LLVGTDIGAAEAIDRLLRIADDEELAGDRPCLLPAIRGGIIGSKQEQDLNLQRIGVLGLVEKEMGEPGL
jgi:hypothetical protein